MDFTQLDLDHKQRILLVTQCLGLTVLLLEKHSDQSCLEWAAALANYGNDEVRQLSTTEVEQKLAKTAAYASLDLTHKQGLLITTCSLSMGSYLLANLLGKDPLHMADQLEQEAIELVSQMSSQQVEEAIAAMDRATAAQQIVWGIGKI